MTADFTHVYKSTLPDLTIPETTVTRFLRNALDKHEKAGFTNKPAFLEAGNPDRVLRYGQIKPLASRVRTSTPFPPHLRTTAEVGSANSSGFLFICHLASSSLNVFFSGGTI